MTIIMIDTSSGGSGVCRTYLAQTTMASQVESPMDTETTQTNLISLDETSAPVVNLYILLEQQNALASQRV